MMTNGVYYFGIPSILQEIFKSQTLQMAVRDHKIENISENIGCVLLKLGRSNLNQSCG